MAVFLLYPGSDIEGLGFLRASGGFSLVDTPNYSAKYIIGSSIHLTTTRERRGEVEIWHLGQNAEHGRPPRPTARAGTFSHTGLFSSTAVPTSRPNTHHSVWQSGRLIALKLPAHKCTWINAHSLSRSIFSSLSLYMFPFLSISLSRTLMHAHTHMHARMHTHTHTHTDTCTTTHAHTHTHTPPPFCSY